MMVKKIEFSEGQDIGDFGSLATSGTYTPTISLKTNLASEVVYPFFYTRIGDIIYVAGKVQFDVIAAATFTQFGFDLPIPPTANFVSVNQASGGTSSGSSDDDDFDIGIIEADVGLKRVIADLHFTAHAASATSIYDVAFTYEVE